MRNALKASGPWECSGEEAPQSPLQDCVLDSETQESFVDLE